jgi:hypothetical protein
MTEGGLAFNTLDSELIIYNSQFTNLSCKWNTTSQGGAIYFERENILSSYENLKILNSTFNNCSSSYGGAVLVKNGKLSSSGESYFDSNYAY